MNSTTDSVHDARDLRAICDRAEIIDLVYRLGVCLDEGRFDEMSELAIEAATVRTPGGESEGREAFIAQARRNHPTDQKFHHVTSNVLVDLDGDRATVRANLVVHITMPDDQPSAAPAPAPVCSIGEVYHFGVVRTTSGWRFAHVEAVPMWLLGTPPPRVSDD